MTSHAMTVEAALRAAAAEFMADRAPQLFITDEQVEREMSTNMLQCSSQWERLEFYGLPLVDDGEYYDETPTTLVLISLDAPPRAQL
jgi:hypothetical protein